MVCPEFPPNSIGGGGEVFRALALSLPECGVELDVVCANYCGGCAERSEGGVRVREIPLIRTPAGMPYLRTTLPPTPAGAARLRAAIENGGYEVAHLHGISFATVDLAARILHRLRVPWVFTLHGSPRTPYALGPAVRAGYAAYMLAYGRFAMRAASLRTAVSDAARRFAPIARYMADSRVVANGINVDEYAHDRPERELLGWPHHLARVMLSIGRIEPEKGFDTAVRALAAMSDRGTAYVILGEDWGMLARLRRLAQGLGVAGRVFALGYADVEQKRFALRRSDLVWIPSRNEAFGLVALEAMASGVPVVASASGGLGEILRDGLEDLLVDPGDADALARTSEALLNEPERLHPLKTRLREHASRYDWGGIARTYAQCYRLVVSSKAY